MNDLLLTSTEDSHGEKLAFRHLDHSSKEKEIIDGMDEIRQADYTGDAISPTEFKHWLDESDIIYDTRAMITKSELGPLKMQWTWTSVPSEPFQMQS